MAAHSAQTVAVISALAEHPRGWRHGYDLAKQTGLKSGTLYPILIRLAERGLVEARWEAEQPAGRPRRHLYRLTADGTATAQVVAAEKTTRGKRVQRTRLAVDGAS